MYIDSSPGLIQYYVSPPPPPPHEMPPSSTLTRSKLTLKDKVVVMAGLVSGRYLSIVKKANNQTTQTKLINAPLEGA